MTKITVFKSADGTILGFKASGHASDEAAGSNIYCAAISAITQTACIGIVDVAKAKNKLVQKNALLSIIVPKNEAETTQCRTIFKTMLLGLASFNEANPGYIQIFEEVQ